MQNCIYTQICYICLLIRDCKRNNSGITTLYVIARRGVLGQKTNEGPKQSHSPLTMRQGDCFGGRFLSHSALDIIAMTQKHCTS